MKIYLILNYTHNKKASNVCNQIKTPKRNVSMNTPDLR